MKTLKNWTQFYEANKAELENTKTVDKEEKVEEANKPGLELDEISTKVISAMKDACCAQTAMDVATILGNVKIEDVNNILTKATKDGIVVKKNIAGKDTFEFIHKP